jgi:hypothetical protein
MAQSHGSIDTDARTSEQVLEVRQRPVLGASPDLRQARVAGEATRGGSGAGRLPGQRRRGPGIVCAVLVFLAAACGGGDGTGAPEAPPVGTVATGVRFPVPATISPDGRWFAYLDGRDTVCVLELVEQAEPACGSSDVLGGDSLVWSADSERLVTGFDLVRFQATRPLVVERDGSLIGRGGEVAEDDMIFEGASAFVGDDVVYVRLEQGSEVAEVVVDSAGELRVVAEVPAGEVTLWPPVVEGDRALLALGRSSEVRTVAMDLEGGDLTEIPLLEGLVVVETVGSTALAVDEQALGLALDEPVYSIADLDDDGLPVPVTRESLRARGAALSPDGELLAVVWFDPTGPIDGAVLAVATVDAVRSGDAVWTDTAIEGAGPIIDRYRRMRWTSATTVTMVVDEAVVTIDVGTE